MQSYCKQCNQSSIKTQLKEDNDTLLFQNKMNIFPLVKNAALIQSATATSLMRKITRICISYCRRIFSMQKICTPHSFKLPTGITSLVNFPAFTSRLFSRKVRDLNALLHSAVAKCRTELCACFRDKMWQIIS